MAVHGKEKKLPKGIWGDLGTFFSMVTASDKDVTRQNAKEYWKIKACRTWWQDDRTLKKNRVWMFRGFIPYGIKPRFRKSDKEWQGGDKAEWTET